jgi:hypothetical protein
MKTTIKYVAPWLAAAAISGAIALAPVASANTDPLVPSGPDPHIPYVLGAPISPDGEQNPVGGVDLPG